MKTTRVAALVIGLAALAILQVCAGDDEAAKKDLAQLQGEWSMVSGSADGMAMPDQLRKQMKRICKGNEVTALMGTNVYFRAKITVDPSKKPSAIDYEMTEGFTKGKHQLGIYELDGETFRACFGKPGEGRPADFKPGEGRTFSVWKREKPGAPAADSK